MIIDGLRGLASRYNLILCDVWGVLHDGLTAFAPAADALARFRALPADGRARLVVLVSNAPRPASSVAAQLDGLGVPRAAYDAIVTSGDITRGLLAARAGARVHHLGPERDLPLFADLDLRLTRLEAAEHVVCTGLFDDETETVEDYAASLALMRAREVPLICANPDLVVERGERLIPCAGALAAAYEALGGEVFYAGKPHAPIYAAAIELAAGLARGDAGAPERSHVLAIGDAIRTDVTGADSYGIASLLVARGIHAGEIGSLSALTLETWLRTHSVRPHAVIETLTW